MYFCTIGPSIFDEIEVVEDSNPVFVCIDVSLEIEIMILLQERSHN